ncbi:RNA methyltransferase [Paludibacter sp. 221]|uniref:TrmH family RNA methyltransferase n=1 Tax=Paludibacter sp. 221 TaxID=2302939 RepID=UPI0013D5EAA3|nr:RNA methyltransferase [Paludibacter sp. 221]NDV46422.1 RNA methyltransferase [Paludibacter sp. 221]
MLSKSKIKLITSLAQKKYRDEYGLFIAESTKLVLDLLPLLDCDLLVATPEWLLKNSATKAQETIEVTENELRKISSQKTPQGVLAVFRKPVYTYDINATGRELSLALDDVQDPGNLGTIIRIADWFGIENVFCSLHTADVFGTKAIQATMGALARVKVHYVDLPAFLQKCADKTAIYGTFMNGGSIYNEQELSPNGIIVMGNEGNGISKEVEKHVSKRLLIPNFPEGKATSESLNVGIATALVCAEFRRRMI